MDSAFGWCFKQWHMTAANEAVELVQAISEDSSRVDLD